MMVFHFTRRHKIFEIFRLLSASLMFAPFLFYSYWAVFLYEGPKSAEARIDGIALGTIFSALLVYAAIYAIKLLGNKHFLTISDSAISSPRFRNVLVSDIISIDYVVIRNLFQCYTISFRNKSWHRRLIYNRVSWIRPRIYENSNELRERLDSVRRDLRKAEQTDSHAGG